MWRKQLIPIFGAACLTITVTDIVLAQPAPFEERRLDQRGGSDADVRRSEDAVRAIEAQRDAGRGARDAFDELWNTNIAEDSIYYKAIIDALSPITGAGFFFWVIVTWIQGQREGEIPWQKLIHPLMVAFLLFNGGRNLAIANQFGRTVIQSTTQSVFDFQIQGVRGRVHLQRQNSRFAANTVRNRLRDRCREREAEVYDACLADAEKSFRQVLAHKRGEDGDAWEQFWENAAEQTQSFVLNNFLINDLSFLAGSFFLIFEWGIVGLAMIAPFLVAMHLLPKGRIGMSMLLGGYVALMTASFSYAALSVAAAAFLGVATAGQPLIYLYITALVNPLIALSLGYLGFSTFLTAPARAFSAASRVFRRF